MGLYMSAWRSLNSLDLDYTAKKSSEFCCVDNYDVIYLIQLTLVSKSSMKKHKCRVAEVPMHFLEVQRLQILVSI